MVHRAFHALPPLTVSKTGEPTGAVYGFVRILLKVLQELKPTHCAIAFDRPTPTFRHLEFEDYKAQRPKAPDELVRQFGRVREVVESLNIPIFEVDGYEADDVLGALSRQASAKDIDTIIATGDADTMQLVSPSVRVLVPQKTFGDTTLYDETAVQQRYGVVPERIPDLKGLKGDPSDNIPGVPGIGEKTAVKLIQQFGSVEGIYEHIDEVAPLKLKEMLAAEEERARLSKRLATIVTDAPVDFEPTKCMVREYEASKLSELFRELEFFSLMEKLSEAGLQADGEVHIQSNKVEGEYHTIDNISALEGVVADLSGIGSFALDLVVHREPTGVEMIGIALSPNPGKVYYLPVGHRGLEQAHQLSWQQVSAKIQPLLEDSRIAKIAHDGKAVMSALIEYGIGFGNLSFDTMIAAYLLGEKFLSLKNLSLSELRLEMIPLDAILDSRRGSIAAESISSVAEHACARVDVIGRLCQPLEAKLRERGLWSLFTEVEMPLIPVLACMERNGVALDTEFLRRMSQSLGEQLLKLEQEIYDYVGHRFNVNSPHQLSTVLFEELKLPGAKRTKSGYSTDASVMEGLKDVHPVVKLILEYRQLMKLRSTYIDALPALINSRTGRLHTSFNQAATATGRLSSSDPNLQNIPIRGELGKQVRQAFVAEPPCLLVGGDYSQIELRILAHMSQEPRLLDAFRKEEDIHASTAAQIFGVVLDAVTPDMRRVAKVVNFGVIYGMSDYGLGQATELSREEAAKFIASYFERHPKVKEYLESTKQKTRDEGYVQTLLGRRRYIPEINSSNRQVREAAERMAINMPLQGTAADIVKLAMIRLQGEMDVRGLTSKMILQVHDELLFEVPPEELEEMKGLILELMPQAMNLNVSLEVEVKVGRNWGEME
jgi:DNA polymerase-1